MANETIRLHGYREFMRVTRKAERETKGKIDARMREAGDIVRADAYQRFQRYDEKSASGFRVRARVGGIFVEQKLRKTTGQHPEYGELQLSRALEPALVSKENEVVANLEKALDELADIVD